MRLGSYIDSLPEHARDRIIEAQAWCVAEVAGEGGGRCLVGHAEDWSRMDAAAAARWREWRPAAGATELDWHCAPQLFAFRGSRPADLAAYRARLLRWGLASEAEIGARFDRLCARRGTAGAVRLVKRRAGRGNGPVAQASGASASRARSASRTRTRSSSSASGTP